MERLQELFTDKNVLVLNAGDTGFMPMVLEKARHVQVVDSKGISWNQKAAAFIRGNPMTYALQEPIDVVWSNVELLRFEDEDIVQFVTATNKLATNFVYTIPVDDSNSKKVVNIIQEKFHSKKTTYESKYELLHNFEEAEASVDENVVAVWSDRKMPLIWRDAVYAGKCSIMSDLYEAQKDFVASLMSPDQPSSYIEVGCGTAEMGSVLFDRVAYTVGVEINPVMLELAKELHPEMDAHPENYLLEGNALELKSILKTSLPGDLWKSTRIVAMLMNTFGILPEHIRQGVINQMIEVAGDDGVVVIGCWHGKSFRRGVEEFYMKNPELCGENVTLDMCDFETSDLWVPRSKYESHWFSEAELKNFVKEYAGKGYSISTHVAGIGIFLTCKKAPKLTI